MAEPDEFYIGYLKQAPPGLARRLRRTVALLVGGGAALALLLAAMQRPFDPGVFEFGAPRSFEGVVSELPYPALLVEVPVESTTNGSASSASRYHLVAEGKHGAGEQVAGLAGQRVRLEGTLIYRDDQTMLEVVTGSVAVLDSEISTAPGVAQLADWSVLGIHTLRGEIVDSKCFLGVMKPGRRKPHRACATRCISSGIPPVFFVETAEGDHHFLLLVDESGQTVNDRVLDFVAEPLEITGRVRRQGNQLVLAADPASYRRLAN